ncbi:MAG: hypothetical protein QOH36_2003 [Actinomycetota bacterium]|nr:hypothetical protein [Actinomycetota bacterium]
MLGLAILAVLAGLAAVVGHPAVVREERRRLDALRQYEGRMVTLSTSARYVTQRTGVLVLDPDGRAVHLEVPEGTGPLGLPSRPRTLHHRVGDIRKVVDCETGDQVRWSWPR